MEILQIILVLGFLSIIAGTIYQDWYSIQEWYSFPVKIKKKKDSEGKSAYFVWMHLFDDHDRFERIESSGKTRFQAIKNFKEKLIPRIWSFEKDGERVYSFDDLEKYRLFYSLYGVKKITVNLTKFRRELGEV